MALYLGVTQLALGLALELRFQHLDADHGRQTLAHVLTGEVGVGLLQDSGLARVAVQHVGQRRPETREVAAALDGVNGVGEGEHVLDEGVVVLKGDLDLGPFDLFVDIERRRVHDRAQHRRVALRGIAEHPACDQLGLGRGRAQAQPLQRGLVGDGAGAGIDGHLHQVAGLVRGEDLAGLPVHVGELHRRVPDQRRARRGRVVGQEVALPRREIDA